MSYRKCIAQYTLTKKHLQLFLEFLSSKGYSVSAIDDYKLLYKVEKDRFVKYLCNIDFNRTECSKLLKDKLFIYLVLEHLKIGIPKGTYFLLGEHQCSNSIGDISDFLRQIQYPIILKPNDSSLGKGITILRKFNQQHIHNAISKVRQYSDVLIVQEYLLGQEYRVVAIEGEIVFALRKHESPLAPEEIPLSGSTCFIDIVRRSMKHLGATICGYDFIVENGSVKVLEINSDPFVFRIKEHLAESTLELYFLKLEQLLRRSYGN